MPRRFTTVAVAVVMLVSLTSIARAQLTHLGFGGGYTAAPNNADESTVGAWNAEAFLLIGAPVIPLGIRPTLFSYGRGTNTNQIPLACPGITCPPTYATAGPERATGGALDFILHLGSGPIAPYLIGGPAAVIVSRQLTPSSTTWHNKGLGYEVGAGAQVSVGPLTVFGEAKYFGTSATASRFSNHSVHMIPLTVGFAF